VVKREEAEVVRQACQLREDNELDKRSRLASGELGLDMYQMREKLERQGLRYVNGWS
jgi:4-hydroxy-4-methyl-2-oxoglutarate aldolase